MIAYLVGKIIERGKQHAVVLCGGVGYAVSVPPSIPDQGETVMLYVHSITNAETGTRLFGFASYEERARFCELLAVDSVGPVTALAIVAANADVRDVKSLCAVRGVGAKTAAKILEALHAE